MSDKQELTMELLGLFNPLKLGDILQAPANLTDSQKGARYSYFEVRETITHDHTRQEVHVFNIQNISNYPHTVEVTPGLIQFIPGRVRCAKLDPLEAALVKLESSNVIYRS